MKFQIPLYLIEFDLTSTNKVILKSVLETDSTEIQGSKRLRDSQLETLRSKPKQKHFDELELERKNLEKLERNDKKSIKK